MLAQLRSPTICSAKLILLFSGIVSAWGGPVDSLMILAHNAYVGGAYDTAAFFYEQLLAENYESAEIYYNMGNARYKLKQLPSAILCYERALRLAPGDPDIAFNLRMAQMRTVDKVEPIPPFFMVVWWDAAANFASADRWACTSVFSFWGLIIFFCYYLALTGRQWKKLCFFLSVIFLFMAVLTCGFAQHRHNSISVRSEAVIFSPSVTVKSSPGETGTDLFILHEGTKVFITDRVGEWSKIKLLDGKSGWLPEGTMERI